MKRLTLLVNGPGELWGWARPLCGALGDRGWHITLQLLPCPFASGREKDVAEEFDIPAVLPPRPPLSLFRALGKEKAEVVLQLGGDLFWGRLCARRAGARLGCYTYGRKPGLERCDRVWTAFPFMEQRIATNRVSPRLVGDLVLDGLALDRGESPWRRLGGRRIVFFPGSRPAIREKALEFLAAVAADLRQSRPSVQIVTLLSPFSSQPECSVWTDAELHPTRLGAGVVLPDADLALTQPGTNTLELMHAGVPALVAVPFQFLRQVPLSGLKGVLAAVPLLGGSLKEHYLRRQASRKGFLSWPNRMGGAEIMKECVGELSPQDVSGELRLLLENDADLRRRARLLKEMSGRAGAAERLADEIEEMVR